MPYWDFARSVTSMRLMTEWGAEHGLSTRQLLAGTAVDEAALRDPTSVVSAKQELRLIRNLVAALGNRTGLGIELGQRYHFTVFGALGFAMVSSQSMREALDVALRYFHLTFAFTQFTVQDEQDLTCVTIDDAELPADVRQFIVERDCAAFVTLERDIFGRQPILEQLSFCYEASSAQQAYADFFGVQPKFGAAHTLAGLNRAALERRLPQANELARQASEQQCRKILDSRSPRSGLSAKVRDCIAARLAEAPTMKSIANDLHMIPRTLRRRLETEGSSYAELRDEVRQTLAEEFLSGPKLSMEQIASRLGYAEATSFINAFRRWHGLTPHAWRIQRR